MEIVAIYREATSVNKSTKTHLLIRQDYSNRVVQGQNFGKDNILLTFENGTIKDKILFNRTETATGTHTKPQQDLQIKGFTRLNNEELLTHYVGLEEQHFKNIKNYYETTKTQQKQQAYKQWEEAGKPKDQKPKKSQTVYKGKPDQLHKEFLIAFGGPGIEDQETMKNLDNPAFYNKCVKAAKSQLELMGLSAENLAAITLHRDEKTLHLHVRYTNFDFKNCQSLNYTTELQNNKDKSKMLKYRQLLLAELQKNLNNSFGFEYEAPEQDKTIKHKTKREWLQEQNEDLEAQNIALTKQVEHKQNELEQDYLQIDFNQLATNYNFKKAKEKLEELETIAKPITQNTAGQDQGITLLNLFLLFVKRQLGIRYKEYTEQNNDYLSIKNDTKNIKAPTRIRIIDKQITK